VLGLTLVSICCHTPGIDVIFRWNLWIPENNAPHSSAIKDALPIINGIHNKT
jgi:hypothetical protein